jgi:hypothetical protein
MFRPQLTTLVPLYKFNGRFKSELGTLFEHEERVPPKSRASSELHSVINQKTSLITVTAVKASNLTYFLFVLIIELS